MCIRGKGLKTKWIHGAMYTPCFVSANIVHIHHVSEHQRAYQRWQKALESSEQWQARLQQRRETDRRRKVMESDEQRQKKKCFHLNVNVQPVWTLVRDNKWHHTFGPTKTAAKERDQLGMRIPTRRLQQEKEHQRTYHAEATNSTGTMTSKTAARERYRLEKESNGHRGAKTGKKRARECKLGKTGRWAKGG